MPPGFLDTLDLVHNIRAAQKRSDKGRKVMLWDWCRTTAYTRVLEVMQAAGITGLHAVPKGLRHGFGVNATVNAVPLNKLQKWLGHANLKTSPSMPTRAEPKRTA